MVSVSPPFTSTTVASPDMGQDFGGGHDPYTHAVSDHDKACMATMARAQGFHSEDVTEPSEIIPAFRRALRPMPRVSRPIWSSSAPSIRSMQAGSETPELATRRLTSEAVRCKLARTA